MADIKLMAASHTRALGLLIGSAQNFSSFDTVVVIVEDVKKKVTGQDRYIMLTSRCGSVGNFNVNDKDNLFIFLSA